MPPRPRRSIPRSSLSLQLPLQPHTSARTTAPQHHTQNDDPPCPVPCGYRYRYMPSPALLPEPRAPQPLLCIQSKNRRQFGCENNPLPRDQFSDWPALTSPRLPCTSTSDLRLDRSPRPWIARFLSGSLCSSRWPSFCLASESFFELPICPFVCCAL
ncbi:hypothetical protein V8C34DRAFT_282320 [Trichoderma compactum]